jgi:hypothetical protein
VGGLIYISYPRSRVRPFGSRVRPPPLQHVPVRARARCCTRPCPDTCPHRNGCVRIAFRPCEDIVFVPGPTRPRPLTYVCARPMFAPAVADARRVHARSHASAPGIRARSHQSARDACAPAFTDVQRVHARPHESAPGVRARSHQSALGPTRPRPLARIRAQRGRACTSGRTRPTSARP